MGTCGELAGILYSQEQQRTGIELGCLDPYMNDDCRVECDERLLCGGLSLEEGSFQETDDLVMIITLSHHQGSEP